MRTGTVVLMLAAALATAACETPTDSGRKAAHVRIQLTDAPSDYLASAVVHVGRIEILSADGPPQVLVEEGGTFDLLQLQDGLTVELGGADLEPGNYTQLRFQVHSAEVTLIDGYHFRDGSMTQRLLVPSGSTSGIKIDLRTADGNDADGMEITPGQTELVIDFDVSQNFKVLGNPEDPAGIKGFVFTPSLRAVQRSVAASVSGTVVGPEGAPLGSVQVLAYREDGADEGIPVTTMAKADGSYAFPYLAPGAYYIIASPPEPYFPSFYEYVVVGVDQQLGGIQIGIGI